MTGAKPRCARRDAAFLIGVLIAIAHVRGAAALTLTPAFSLRLPHTVSVVTAVGDITGDGVSDIVALSAQRDAGGAARDSICVYVGGAAFDSLPAFCLASPDTTHRLWPSCAGGDVDGDGIGDLIVGATDRAFVYAGPVRAGATPRWILTSGAPDTVATRGDFGANVSVAPDIDGDGFDDLLVGAPGGVPSAYGFHGGPQFDAQPDIRYNYPGVGGEQLSFALRIAGVGDVDGDGFGDVAIRDRWFSVWIVWGSTDPQPRNGLEVVRGSDPADFVPLGDADGDGRADLVTTQYFTVLGGNSFTRINVRSGRDATPTAWPASGGLGGGYVSVATGDVTGDGLPDLVIRDTQSCYACHLRTFLRVVPSAGDGREDSLAVFRSGAVSVAGDLFGDGTTTILNGTQVIVVSAKPRLRLAVDAPTVGTAWPVGGLRTIRWRSESPVEIVWLSDDGTTHAIARDVGGHGVDSLAVRVPAMSGGGARVQFTPSDTTWDGRVVSERITLPPATLVVVVTRTPAPHDRGERLSWSSYPALDDVVGYDVERRTSTSVWDTLASRLHSSAFTDPLGTRSATYRVTLIDGWGEPAVTAEQASLDDSFELAPDTGAFAYPIPCRASGCTIALGLASPLAAPATVRVFDMHGALVRTLTVAAGAARAAVTWDARDAAGRRVASGIYEARVASGATTRRVRIPVVR